MGYYDYQNSFIRRHVAHGSGWDVHLENCRRYILKAIDRYRPHRITALGSGWLLELPLVEMLEMADEVVLVDIVHPPDVSKQVEGLKGVRVVERDLSGGLVEEVWRWRRSMPFFRRPANLAGLRVPDYRQEEDPGLIISLNLLTQIDVLPVRFLRRTARIDRQELDSFRREVQEKHIAYLSQHTSVLITDCEEITTNVRGRSSGEKTLVAGIPECADREEWTWSFNIEGTDYYNSSSVLKVLACTVEGGGNE
jgi:hypothetical protein